MIPKNTQKVIAFLVRNIDKPGFNVNQLARELSISPSNALYILQEFKNKSIVKTIDLKTSIYYTYNFSNEEARTLAAFVLLQNDFNNYAKVLVDDLTPLKEISLSCILFGSVLKKGKEAEDIDILLISEEFSRLHTKLNSLRDLKPKKIHDVLMTQKDFAKNIARKDAVVLNILKDGAVLWGSDIIVKALEESYEK